MQIRDYYHKKFKVDLSGFLPDEKMSYFGHAWQHDCGNLYKVNPQSRATFLICLYFTVLMDQAMHAHFNQYYLEFANLTRYPKFCHGLAQFHKNPRDILYFPVKKGLVDLQELETLLPAGMELFVDEVTDFFQGHMPKIRAGVFFEKLINDPDFHIPLICVLADGNLRENIALKIYEDLKKAVKNRFSVID